MSGKANRFRMPEKPSHDVEEWVAGEAATSAAPAATTGRTLGGKLARLTIDLPPELHARFKSTCALKGTRMIDEVRGFIEEWTQKHR